MLRHRMQSLYRQSYQVAFLWKTALVILGLGVATGYILFQFSPNAELINALDSSLFQYNENESEYPLPGLDDTELSFPEQLSWIVEETEYQDSTAIQKLIVESEFTPEETRIAKILVHNLEGKEDRLSDAFKILLEENPPVPWAYYAEALFWEMRGYYRTAARAYEREGLRPEADIARESAVGLYIYLKDFKALTRLAQVEDYSELLEKQWAYIHFEQAIAEKDWPGILRWLVPALYEHLTWQTIIITLIVGLAWLVFLLHIGDVWKHPGRLGLCLFALVLGAISTWPTILLLVWQEDFLGLKESQELVGGVLYFVAGVGLREEAMKLLLFLPCLPFLLKYKEPLLAIVVAGCVGLGFAVEENLNYLHASSAMSGPARFLTANFLHVSATGLVGFACYQMIRDKGRSLDNFATVFGLVVIAHGIYDALISLPFFADLGYVSMVIYIILCIQLFRVLDFYKGNIHYRISLSWVFTTAISVVFATVLGYVISLMGLRFGMMVMIPSILGLGSIVIAFFKIIDERLA